MPDRSEMCARRPLKHLVLCREYPPAPYPAGGIGTYARHIAALLAEAGETVHLIAQRWEGAPDPVVRSCDGRLTIHRIPLDVPVGPIEPVDKERALLKGLASSTCPAQLFSWQAARYAERLIEEEGIDLIEAQEWEAPLYFLQLRRMLELGPERKPPCLIHLHSPSQMIFAYNEWDKTLVDYLPLTRFEEFTIRSADSLICPSRFLAHDVAGVFGLAAESITVIRHPMGETSILARGPEVWSRDAVCYVGRLELRKGVVEWVDAAISVALTQDKVTFHFFGSDTTVDGGSGESVLAYLNRRIPRTLRSRFRFHGIRSREQLDEALGTFSIAVVPSRWDNLPYTCIEAMATGLPILVSPNGGMAELIVDGESGWVAEDGSPARLAEALTRALASPPSERAAYGVRAAESVRRLCANRVVVASHLEHRSKVVGAGRIRSDTVPGNARIANRARRGFGFVIVCSGDSDRLSATIASVGAQTQPVFFLVVLDAALRDRAQMDSIDSEKVLFVEDCSYSQAARAGFEALLAQKSNLQAVAILDQTMRLAPSFAVTCQNVLLNQPGVGLVSSWVAQEGTYTCFDTGPLPVAAGAIRKDSLPCGCAIRVEAVLAPESERWSAVTYPEPLLFVHAPHSVRKVPRRRYSGMALIQNPSTQFALDWFLAMPMRQKLSWVGRIALHPYRVIRWVVSQLRRRMRSTSARDAA